MHQIEAKHDFSNLKKIAEINWFSPQNTKIISWFFSKIFYEYIVIDPFQFYWFENNSMFWRTDKTDFNECILFQEIDNENSPNMKFLLIEYKIHRRSYLWLKEKFNWQNIYEDDAFLIFELDRNANRVRCA